VEDGDRRAADGLHPRELDDSRDAERVLRAARGHADRVAELEVPLPGRALVDRDLLRRRGPPARCELQRVEALLAVRIHPGREVRRAAARDRLAVLVDQLSLVVAAVAG